MIQAYMPGSLAPKPGGKPVTEIDTVTHWHPYQGETWEVMTSGQVIVPQGADLIPGNLLLGVPFIITRAVFRPGDIRTEKGADTHLYYVSLELVTAPHADFDRARKRGRITEECAVEPGEELVFNDGSTGVYRQMVQVFSQLGWITNLPENKPENGEKGESRYDFHPSLWEWTPRHGEVANIQFNPAGEPVISANVRILCKRGLRVSKYDHPEYGESETFYIA